MEPILLDLPSELRTERLVLRPPRAGDGALVNEAVLESAADLAAWMPWAVPTPKVEDTEKWCREAAAKWLKREEIHFSLYLLDGGICVGACGMHHITWNVPLAEIGYWLRTPYSGKGLMTEAVNALTALALETLKVQRVEIRCDEHNARSAAVSERTGYRLDGILRNNSRDPAGVLRSTRVYSRLPADRAKSGAAG